jgi:hypothetical protein
MPDLWSLDFGPLGLLVVTWSVLAPLEVLVLCDTNDLSLWLHSEQCHKIYSVRISTIWKPLNDLFWPDLVSCVSRSAITIF